MSFSFSNYLPGQKLTNVLVLLACCIGTGIWAVELGQDINWDLKNYHFYNPYALFNNKLMYDYAPAMAQSFNNPLLDIPVYWLIQYCKPVWVGFILGAVQGLNLFVLFLLVKKLTDHYPAFFKEILIVFACAMGFYAAANLSEIGTTFGDNVVSLFIIYPLYLLVGYFIDQQNNSTGTKNSVFIIAGLIMGIGTGAKLTVAIYPIALAIALFWVSKNFFNYIKIALLFGFSVFLGFISSIGYWMYTLWTKFGSPLFPYFNSIFKSPYYRLTSFSDQRFFPDDLMQKLFYPFYFVKQQHYTAELIFRDIRLAICYTLLVILLGYLGYRAIASKRNDSTNPFSRVYFFIITFCVSSYIFWQTLFSIYRYTVVLEFLSPVFIIIIFDLLLEKKKIVALSFVPVALFTILTVVTMNWGRLPWEDSYFGVETPKINGLEKSTIIMTGHEPSAYIVPFFPQTTRFLRAESNLLSTKDTTLFQKELEQHLSKSQDNYFLLINTSPEELNRFEERYQLSLDSSSCINFKTRLDPKLCLCRLNPKH